MRGRFVVYQGIQCYPEFLILYERVTDDYVELDLRRSRMLTEDNGLENDENEIELLDDEIEHLEKQLVLQRERRAAAEERQNDLNAKLQEKKAAVRSLENPLPYAAKKSLCCTRMCCGCKRSKLPKSLLKKYLLATSQFDDIDDFSKPLKRYTDGKVVRI